MPKIKINDTTIAYETWGDGPPVVLTPHGWFMRNALVYVLAGRLAKQHRVILWDRPNSGASDISIADVPSELDLWADVMHGFLAELDLGPAYFCGGSNGCVFSLFMAHRYPADVKGLILLDAITDDMALSRPIFDARYLEFADIAKTKGMQAVIDHSAATGQRGMPATPQQPWDGIRKWIVETIGLNPANQERLLTMDAHYFGTVMQRWGEWYLTKTLNVANLSAAELQQITMPTLVLPGVDPLHTHHSAVQLADLLPNAELADYASHYSSAEVRAVQESDAISTQKIFLMLPFVEEFLDRQA